MAKKTKALTVKAGSKLVVDTNPDFLYKIKLLDGKEIVVDFNHIAKKKFNDLLLELEKDTKIIFKDFFKFEDANIVLPSPDGAFYLNANTFIDEANVLHEYEAGEALTTQAVVAETVAATVAATGGFMSYIPLVGIAGGLSALGGGGEVSLDSEPPISATVNSANDELEGGAGDDKLQGDDRHNTIKGMGGDDKLWGYEGDDSLWGGAGNDSLYGGDGLDILSGGDGNDLLDSGAGNDFLVGGAGNDLLVGGAGNNFLDGGADNDTINGDEGDDAIEGNEGNDTLTGGAGKDTFAYLNVADGIDTITDFLTGAGIDADVLNLSPLLIGYNPSSGLSITNFISFTDNGTDTTLDIDADGGSTGAFSADVTIHLQNVTGVDLNTMIADGNIVLV